MVIFVLRYDPVTGKGAIGVEFAGTAVTSSSGLSGGSPEAADATSRVLVSNKVPLDLYERSLKLNSISRVTKTSNGRAFAPNLQ
ncbi:MAG TPA: hypothetical protein VGO47_02850 [Chlamydiales bacterium]|nr:hypothetical protein [Chlamydiales bacterium]